MTLPVVLVVVLVLVAVAGALLLRHFSENPSLTGEMHTTKPAFRKDTHPAVALAPRAPSQASPQLPAASVRNSPLKEAADQQLTKFLKARQRLENLGAAQWGNGTYEEILQLANQGDAQYRNESFAAAAAFYGRAMQKAGRLAAGGPAALEKLMTQSLEAIEAGDGESARQKLWAARKIDPGNRQVKKLLQRAVQAEKVQQLFQNGQRLEKDAAAERALTQYRRALELDPDAVRVRKAYHDLSVQVADAKYRRFMSQGLSAFERREYHRARDSLLKAQAVKPGAAQVRDALSQVNVARQKQRMDILRQQALAAEAAENWTLALQSYRAALAMDDKIAFAVDGKQRIEVQIRRSKHLDFFLEKPQSLQYDRRLDQARELIRELEAAPVHGSRLSRDTQRLKRLVTLYATPVLVTIVSDGLTNVAVYRVGRLGRFTIHRLQLLPGIYTIVGSRDGYQDVRRKIIVKPGRQPFQITIACKTRV